MKQSINMLSDKIPKKVSVPIKPMPFSPLLNIFIEVKMKQDKEKRSVTRIKKYWPNIVENHFQQNFGAKTGSWVDPMMYRPKVSVRKSTIMKTGCWGGSLQMTGAAFKTGLKTKNGSEWIVASSDNTKTFTSLGSRDKVFTKPKEAIKPLKEDKLVYPAVKVSKIKLKLSFDPRLKRGLIKHSLPTNAPNLFWSPADASDRLIICSHLIGKPKKKASKIN